MDAAEWTHHSTMRPTKDLFINSRRSEYELCLTNHVNEIEELWCYFPGRSCMGYVHAGPCSGSVHQQCRG